MTKEAKKTKNEDNEGKKKEATTITTTNRMEGARRLGCSQSWVEYLLRVTETSSR